MKTYDVLKQKMIREGKNWNHISPVLEGLCGIIDGQNRRIEALKRRVNKLTDADE